MPVSEGREYFNDAIATYFPSLSRVSKLVALILTKVELFGALSKRALLGGRALVNERIVEYPVVLRWMRTQGRVLDIGCVSSRLPIHLASLGYEVHGLDVQDYPFHHPNFTFHKADLFAWSPPLRFDIITAVSVIEHLGLGQYGTCDVGDGDRTAVEILRQWLSPGGQLLVSVPFGTLMVTGKHRIYDAAQLAALFRDFTWLQQAYFRRVKEDWVPCSPEDLAGVASPGMPVNGVAILELAPCEPA